VRNAHEAIRLTGRSGSDCGLISVELNLVGGAAFLRISDDGIGLAYESRDRVFEPFFTTKEVGKSMGLGLATAHGIIKDHRGSIAFYSQPGRGAELTITLPLSNRSRYSADEITRYEELRRPLVSVPAKPE
jgi:signal transduction histidine kinase